MTNDLTVRPTTAIDYASAKMRETIRSTVAVGATDTELDMFIAFCQSTGLNPFKKEIWFIKTKGYMRRDGTHVEGRVQMMTGINGFFQIANKHPEFNGMEAPEFEEDASGNPIKCTVRVHRKDRHFPSVGVARWREFFPGKTDKGNSLWETKPFHMLAKVAKAIALREAFPQELNGLYTEDEVHEVVDVEPVPHPLDAIPAPKEPAPVRKSLRPGETGKQAETRELMATGNSWMYGPGFIEVDEKERRALWARLVRDHGAITDDEGMIHTSTRAAEIDYAITGEPGRNVITTEGGDNANAVRA